MQPPSDKWLDIVTGAGAIAAVAGVAGGTIFAARYGRRASLSVSAKVLATDAGFVIVARPSVKAVGVFRVKFKKGDEGSRIHATEMYLDSSGTPQQARTYSHKGFFREAFVDGGEELVTTTLVPVPIPDESVIGWAVWVQVLAPNRFVRLGWLRWWLRRKTLRSIYHWEWVKAVRGHLPPGLRSWVRFVIFESGWYWTDQVFVSVPRLDGGD